LIKSFNDADTELLWNTGKSRRIPASIRTAALRKLVILHWATSLSDLAVPGGNHLDALKRDRQGQHSIRVNNQYRICFVWRGTDAFNVEIIDYH
jgi:toxin HigB-1